MSIGINSPRASVDGGAFTFIWIDPPTVCTDYGPLSNSTQYGNALVLTGVQSTSQRLAPLGIITPEQAASIDSKMDDGVPGTGNVRSFGSSTSGCTTTTDATTAAYALTTTTNKCAPIFLTGY